MATSGFVVRHPCSRRYAGPRWRWRHCCDGRTARPFPTINSSCNLASSALRPWERLAYESIIGSSKGRSGTSVRDKPRDTENSGSLVVCPVEGRHVCECRLERGFCHRGRHRRLPCGRRLDPDRYWLKSHGCAAENRLRGGARSVPYAVDGMFSPHRKTDDRLSCAWREDYKQRRPSVFRPTVPTSLTSRLKREFKRPTVVSTMHVVPHVRVNFINHKVS